MITIWYSPPDTPPLADRDYPDIEDLLITSDKVKNIIIVYFRLQQIIWMWSDWQQTS